MKYLSVVAIVGHLTLLVSFSVASLSAASADVSESPFFVKEYYARNRDLCDEFIGNFKAVSLENYKKFNEVQKKSIALHDITLFNDGEDVLGLVTGQDLLWKRGDIMYERYRGNFLKERVYVR